MFNIPILALARLSAVGILVSVLGIHIYSDIKTKEELDRTKEQLIIISETYKVLQSDFLKSSKDKEEFKIRATEAEIIRTKINTDLKNSLVKIKNQVVPQDCKKAVEWAAINKSDLSW